MREPNRRPDLPRGVLVEGREGPPGTVRVGRKLYHMRAQGAALHLVPWKVGDEGVPTRRKAAFVVPASTLTGEPQRDFPPGAQGVNRGGWLRLWVGGVRRGYPVDTHPSEVAKMRAALGVMETTTLGESAMTVADLPEGIYVRVWRPKRDSVVVVYTSSSGKKVGGPVWGEVWIAKPKASFGPCGGAWMVEHSNALSGWGPLLYDVALEVASRIAGGLTPDRREVSQAAHRVWRFYRDRRPDVEVHQLDDLDGTLTPRDPSDDCSQDSTMSGGRAVSKFRGNRLYQDKPNDWYDQPEAKRYVKKRNTVLRALHDAGKLILAKVAPRELGL